MSLKDCYNFEDFRKLAKKKLPAPIFHYIDGGADDEITLKRNTEYFNKCWQTRFINDYFWKKNRHTNIFVSMRYAKALPL